MPFTLLRNTIPPRDFLTSPVELGEFGRVKTRNIPPGEEKRQPFLLDNYTYALMAPSSPVVGVMIPVCAHIYTIVIHCGTTNRAAVSCIGSSMNDLSFFYRQIEYLTEGQKFLEISVLALSAKEDAYTASVRARSEQEIKTALDFAAYESQTRVKVTFRESVVAGSGVIKVLKPNGSDPKLPVEILTPSPGEQFDGSSIVRTHWGHHWPNSQVFGAVAMLENRFGMVGDLMPGQMGGEGVGAGATWEAMDLMKKEWERQGPFSAGIKKGGDTRDAIRSQEQAKKDNDSPLGGRDVFEMLRTVAWRLMSNGKYCYVCGREEKLKLCTGCNFVRYCSSQHAKEDWVHHKEWCKKNPAPKPDEEVEPLLQPMEDLGVAEREAALKKKKKSKKKSQSNPST